MGKTEDYNFVMNEMSQGEREHLFHWQGDNKYIYESPDGKYVFRREVGEDYNPSDKEEIDLKTGEPTGRTFEDYPFNKTSIEDKVRKLVMEIPNDMELGQKVRYLFPIEEKLSKEYLDFWTCDHCGKNTHEVEYDYLGNNRNHLQCELELENERTKSK